MERNQNMSELVSDGNNVVYWLNTLKSITGSSICVSLVGNIDLCNNLHHRMRDAFTTLSKSPQWNKEYNKMIGDRPIIVIEEIIALIIQESGAKNINGSHGELGYFQVKEPLVEQKARQKYGTDWQGHVESQLILNKLQGYGLEIAGDNRNTILGLQRRLDIKKSWLFSFDRMKSQKIINLSPVEQDQLIYLSYNRGSILKAMIWKCFNNNQLKKPVTFSQIMDLRYNGQEHHTTKTFKSPQFKNLIVTSETDFTVGGETDLKIDVKKPSTPQEHQLFHSIFALLYDKWLSSRNGDVSYSLSPNDKRIATKYMVQVKTIKKLVVS